MTEQKNDRTSMEYLFQKIHGCKDEYKRSECLRKGYVQMNCPEHPYCWLGGWMFEHRFLLEKKVGRFLKPEEECHHLNHIRSDNCSENLTFLASKSEHMRMYHSKQFDPALIETVRGAAKNYEVSRVDIAERIGVSVSTIKNICRNNNMLWIGSDEHELNEHEVQEMLKTDKPKQVAECLGIHVHTLRRRFPNLLPRRKPSGYLDQYKKKVLALRDRGQPLRAIGKEFDVTMKTVSDAIARWNRPEDYLKYEKKNNRFLDEHQKEIYKLLLIGVSQVKIASKFETNRTSLSVAIRRWSAQGAVPPEVARLLNSNKNRIQKV